MSRGKKDVDLLPVVVLTGGIGAGKTYVSSLLRERGFAIYDCDTAAKRIMQTSKEVREALCRLVGSSAYIDGVLNKQELAQFILKGEDEKQAVNAVVHPAVAEDFRQSGLNWIESAIFYESRFNELISYNYVVCVSAPDELRIDRIVERDGISRQKAREWLLCQMPQEEIMSHSDFVINNDGREDLGTQICRMLNNFDLNGSIHTSNNK